MSINVYHVRHDEIRGRPAWEDVHGRGAFSLCKIKRPRE